MKLSASTLLVTVLSALTVNADYTPASAPKKGGFLMCVGRAHRVSFRAGLVMVGGAVAGAGVGVIAGASMGSGMTAFL